MNSRQPWAGDRPPPRSFAICFLKSARNWTLNAIAQGDKIVSVTIEGDAADLLASVAEVAEWNAALDG